MKHTPGPWSERNGRIFQTDREELTIANVGRAYDGDYSPANARLIAAAPDLLEALSSIDIYLSDTLSGRVNPDPATYKQWLIDGITEARNRARAAIAKATGSAT